jgi:hypothetical protein
LGVFATRLLVLGDIIMSEEPVMVGHCDIDHKWQLAAFDAWVRQEFKKLDSSSQVGLTRFHFRAQMRPILRLDF